MIFLYLAFFALGVGVFFLTLKLGLSMRFAVAFAAFIIPSIIVTLWVIRTGDKPAPDAITVFPKQDEDSKTMSPVD